MLKLICIRITYNSPVLSRIVRFLLVNPIASWRVMRWRGSYDKNWDEMTVIVIIREYSKRIVKSKGPFGVKFYWLPTRGNNPIPYFINSQTIAAGCSTPLFVKLIHINQTTPLFVVPKVSGQTARNRAKVPSTSKDATRPSKNPALPKSASRLNASHSSTHVSRKN